MSQIKKSRNLESLLTLSEGRTQPPTDYAYDVSIKSDFTQEAIKIFQFMFKMKPVEEPEKAFQYGLALWRGDSVSDAAFVSMQVDNKNPHRLIEKFLQQGIDGIENPSDEFQALWDQVSVAPAWLDWELLEKGALAYRRFGVTGFQYQGIASLDSYRNEAIAKTLMSTGQYSDDTAFNRFVLTCNFWLQISEPNSMQLFGEGWKIALRIRLLHTLIRSAVLNNESWDEEHYGMPINQVGLMGAPLISSLMLGTHLKMLGYRTTREETLAMMHLWRYIAFLMGVEEGSFPTSIEEGAQTLFTLSQVEQLTEAPEGIRIGRSFIDAFKPPQNFKGFKYLHRWIEYKSSIGQSLFFVTPPTREILKIPNTLFWGIVYVVIKFPLNFIQDTLRLNVKAYAQYLDKNMRRKRQLWLNRQLSEADMVYRPESKF